MPQIRLFSLSLLTAALFGAASAPSDARADYFDCKVGEVGMFVGSRAHIRCSNSISLNGNTVRWIAIAHDSPAFSQFIALGKSALLGGKIFAADIPVTAGTNVAGCAVADCRTPVTFKLKITDAD